MKLLESSQPVLPGRFEDAAGRCALLLLGLAPESRTEVLLVMAKEFRATIEKQQPNIDFNTLRAVIHAFIRAISMRLRQLDRASNSETGHA